MLIRVTDEQPDDRGNRQDLVRPWPGRRRAVGDQADQPGTIPGDLPASASLSTVWQALHDSLHSIPGAQRCPPIPAASAKLDEPLTGTA